VGDVRRAVAAWSVGLCTISVGLLTLLLTVAKSTSPLHEAALIAVTLITVATFGLAVATGIPDLAAFLHPRPAESPPVVTAPSARPGGVSSPTPDTAADTSADAGDRHDRMLRWIGQAPLRLISAIAVGVVLGVAGMTSYFIFASHDTGPKIYTEREEFGAPSYANYASGSGLTSTIATNQLVHVLCRVPGNDATPASVGRAGWYKIEGPGRSDSYVAANTFYNDPGNGGGEVANNSPFDPAVREC
jgi:hypothetical protein